MYKIVNKYAHILPFLTWAVVACGPTVGADVDASGGGADGMIADDGGVVTPDAPQNLADSGTPVDAGNLYPDATPTGDGGCPETTCPSPVPDGCGAVEICGNGADDDCNLLPDDLCSCTPGAVQPCFLGQPGHRGVGSCQDGTQRCEGATEFGAWGACEGGIWPSADQCDTQDNDCNGCIDDNPACCTVELTCPGPGDMPDGAPFSDYVIDGTMFYGGTVSTWNWTVTGGPCDQLLEATTGMTSYTLAGTSTSTLTFHPTLSGDYTITVTMTLPDGTVYTCTFIVHIGGPGLRVELCWDTTGDADIDLHLHRATTTTNFFTTGAGGTNVNPDDCYYYNCKAGTYICPLPGPFCGGWTPPAYAAEWGYTNSPISECAGGPEGSTWMMGPMGGFCHNPRLDIDNIDTVGIPENINVDNPNDGETFRPMVHYYGGSVVTHPLVNIYCGGTLTATYGAAPDLVPSFNAGPGFGMGPMWRVADITVAVDATGTTTGCAVDPLHPEGMASGYRVGTDNNRSYDGF